jgi:c-di-GMP-binding flagellar brake protein YcgR
VSEQRSRYRIRDGLEPIKVSVARLGENPRPARLVDLSERGAALLLPTATAQTLPLSIGSRLFLSFELPGLPIIDDVLAEVRHVRDEPSEQLVGCAIVNWERFQETLPERVFALFNRRRDHRVELPHNPPVQVEVAVQGGGSPLLARLADLSLHGCALLFAPGRAPKRDDTLTLSFCLPDADYEYRLTGRIRSLTGVGDAIRCGFEFRHERSRDDLAQQQRILLFVTRMQREETRRERAQGGF